MKNKTIKIFGKVTAIVLAATFTLVLFADVGVEAIVDAGPLGWSESGVIESIKQTIFGWYTITFKDGDKISFKTSSCTGGQLERIKKDMKDGKTVYIHTWKGELILPEFHVL